MFIKSQCIIFYLNYKAYQQNFNGQIIRTDGKRIAEEMKAKMEVIFSENVLALKVILITRAQLRHLKSFLLIPILSPSLTWPNYILEFTNKSGRRPERLPIPTKFELKCH